MRLISKLSVMLFCTILVLSNFVSQPAHAATDCASASCADGVGDTYNGPPPKFVALADYSKSPKIQKAINSTGPNALTDYINAVFRILLSVGAFAAVIRITWAGYLYMGSADMWSKKDVARKMFTDTIIGLLILFAVYLILFQINPNLLNLNILTKLQTIKTSVVGGQ